MGTGFLICAKNYAKEMEKGNVGFSPNWAFFGDQKNCQRELNLDFFLKVKNRMETPPFFFYWVEI